MPTVVSARTERDRLLDRYQDRLTTNEALDRRVVSFQANRNVAGFGWLKYREAFSAPLAGDMVSRYSAEGGTVLDPFAGIGTTLFAASALGRRGVGIELLPIGAFTIEARLAARTVDPRTFRRAVQRAAGVDWAARHDPAFAQVHIPITRGAYAPATERALTGFRAWCARLRSPHVRRLFHLAALDVLESISFTRKDGQYLRWDGRAPRPGRSSSFRKPRIEPFADAIRDRLERLADDLERSPHDAGGPPPALHRGSCLEILPLLGAGQVDLVVTSPPYCNRYDYTRTYALELVWLELGDDDVKRLRQTMLSCTVENAAKLKALERAYRARGCAHVPRAVLQAVEAQAALQEVLARLEHEGDAGRLNNGNIPRMVRNYFLEMAFVIYELARTLRPGGRIVMVNDNVRYAGEEVPVDLILSDLAARLGLEVEHIWKLARGKGNSSQQMGVHGRTELRKGVYVWKRPGVILGRRK